MGLGLNRGSTPMQGPCPTLEAQAWVLLGEKGGFGLGWLAAWGSDYCRVAASLTKKGHGLIPH